MSICRVISCIFGRQCLLWPVCSLGKTLLAFDLLHCVLQGQIYLLLQVSLDFLLFHSSPLLMKRTSFGDVSSRSISITWSIDLDYSDIEWFALETARDLSVIFDIASKYCISDSFVDMMATPFLLRDSCPQ